MLSLLWLSLSLKPQGQKKTNPCSKGKYDDEVTESSGSTATIVDLNIDIQRVLGFKSLGDLSMESFHAE